MQGNKNRFYSYLRLLLLGFVLFSFSFKFSLQEGKLAFAYNTYNLERSSAYERLVQNPAVSEEADSGFENNSIGIF